MDAAANCLALSVRGAGRVERLEGAAGVLLWVADATAYLEVGGSRRWPQRLVRSRSPRSSLISE